MVEVVGSIPIEPTNEFGTIKVWCSDVKTGAECPRFKKTPEHRAKFLELIWLLSHYLMDQSANIPRH